MKKIVSVCVLSVLAVQVFAESKLLPIGEAWSKNSVNAVIFRHNSVVSNDKFQFAAYYDEEGNVILAKRRIGSKRWKIQKTQYKGNMRDAHNTISIMLDGDGYLHMSWDHHGNPLRYCRSTRPGSLEMTEMMPMSGALETNVTYPEFYRLANGNLIFLYRDGASGRGNLMMNHYDVKTQTWTQRQNGFLDGQGRRNAYWQMCSDSKGNLHLSWVWRESSDVASNHDMGYAVSRDGGVSWETSTGEAYELPITIDNTEYAARIPQSHELINTTAMCADSDGNPYIVTYYRKDDSNIPQYHLIYNSGEGWKTSQITQRTMPFSLSGSGSKRIPISRPRVVVDSTSGTDKAYMLFRDEERGSRVSVAMCSDLSNPEWTVKDLTDFSVGLWEPSYDTEQWQRDKVLGIYVQNVGQGDGETIEDIPPQTVSILEWKPE